MQEIKIPEGCKASIDFEKRVVVIEGEKPKFKRGDVLISNYFILPFMGINENKAILFNCYYDIKNRKARVTPEIKVGCGYFPAYRLATPSEQQLLFDALAKEGKKWNAEKLQIEDIEKDILVPESIGIYQCKEDFGFDFDGLYIAFNNNTQLLYYNSKYKVWCACPLHSGYIKVQCKLISCKREDLKSGDTAFISETFRLDDSMLSDLGRYVKIIGDKAIKINKKGEPIYDNAFYNHWYKIEPINK